MQETNIEAKPSYHVNIMYAGDIVSQYSDTNFERFIKVKEYLEKECKERYIRKNDMYQFKIEVYQYL